MARRKGIDMSRIATAAVEAAFEDEHQPRRHFSGAKAVATGVALAAVARVAVKKAPGLLPTPPSLSNLTDNVRDRLAEHGWLDEEEPLDQEEPLDEAEGWDEEEDEDEPEDDEGPSGEDDEWEDEDETDDEPQGSGDDEPEQDEEDDEEPDEEEDEESAPALELGANGSGGDTSGRAPDLMRALSGHRRPPVMRSGDRGRDPAAEPPEPPKRKSKAGKS